MVYLMSMSEDVILMLHIIFLKQKTAYEMRISDWSSDVCSSDLTAERTVDFAEFDRTAARVANFLVDAIALPGSLVGFMGKNSFDFYFALFGCARTRAGLVIFNWRLAPAELAGQIADSEASHAIVEREQAELWEAACAHLSGSEEHTSELQSIIRI